VLCLAVGCSSWKEPSETDIRDLQNNIEIGDRPQFVSNDKDSLKRWDWTKQVYTLQGFRPAWTARGHVQDKADSALQTLENARDEGLEPEDFEPSKLRAIRVDLEKSKDPNALSQFDIRLTYALVRYVSQLCFGRIDPQQVHPDWPASKKNCAVPQLVHDAIQKDAVADLAKQVSPTLPEYHALKATLKQYREMAAKGDGLALATGDVTQFQSQHGLKPDGILNEKTTAAMNVPLEQRIEQIEINLDRMRWMADSLEPHHIRVNIPAFHLSVHDGDKVPLEMRVIVGSGDNRTPILDDKIEYIVFSPYWNIPLSIASKELLPKIQKDPNYLRKENIEVVRSSGGGAQVVDPSSIDWEESNGTEYQLRQRPGASNALGLVKFIFPNRHNVYLHDTPGDNLFDRLTRTLSHGCIRVESPVALANYVLKDQPEWTAERIEKAMHAGRESRVSLKTPLPVHVHYWTAWTDAAGQAQFREDVYGYDEKHRAALPAPHSADIDVNKVGARVVPNAAGFHSERRVSNQ
jgi:murein L,D-transpeptidase YcbB/YkuD